MYTLLLSIPTPLSLLVDTFPGFEENLFEKRHVPIGTIQEFCAHLEKISTHRKREISLTVSNAFGKFRSFWC
jgi:hypothetical protein